MGVLDLSKHLRDGSKKKNNLKELKGKRVGVDLSVWLHELYARQDFAHDFHCLPPVDLFNHVAWLLDEYHSLFKTNSVTMVLFADGCPHPGKGETDKERRAKIDVNIEEFRALQKNGSPEDNATITKLMKNSCYTRKDLIFNVKTWCSHNQVEIIGCPFETDPQQVAAELVEYTNASCTTD